MANRKQRRKSKDKTIYNIENEENTRKILITVGIVIFVLGLFYLITILVNNSKMGLNTKEPEKEVATIQYVEILAEDTFSMKPDEYYVLFYDFDGPSASLYDYIFGQYKSVKGQYIYKVDLGNGFNNNILSDKTNKSAQNASDLKVKDATLIKISNGENVKYIEGDFQLISKGLV
jgi:hypothetical protein